MTITHGASSTDGKYGGGELRNRLGGGGGDRVALARGDAGVARALWTHGDGAGAGGGGGTAGGAARSGCTGDLAGHALGMPETVAASDKAWTVPDGESGIGAWQPGSLPEQARSVTERELLDGSSFGLTGGSRRPAATSGCGAAGRTGASTGARANWCSTAR